MIRMNDIFQDFRKKQQESIKNLPRKVTQKISKDKKKIMKQLRATNVCLYDTKTFNTKVSWDVMFRAAQEYSKKFSKKLGKNVLFFPIIFNYKGHVFTLNTGNQQNILFIGRKSKDFLGFHENIRADMNIDMEISYPFRDGIVVNEGVTRPAFSLLELKQGHYEVVGLRVPRFIPGKRFHKVLDYLLIFDAKKILPKMDIFPILRKINSIRDLHLSWNIKNKEPIFSDDEMVIILSSMIGLDDEIGVNLILSSMIPQVGKSTILTVMSKITNDPIVSGTQLREKGLTPSFFGDVPSVGVILSAEHVVLINEFLRYLFKFGGGNLTHRKALFQQYFQSFTEIFERQDKISASGKGQYKWKCTAGFLTTCNIEQTRLIRDAWQTGEFGDRAPIMRVAFLMMSKNTVEKAREMPRIASLSKAADAMIKLLPLKKTEYRHVISFIKRRMYNVVYSAEKLDRIINKIDTSNDKQFAEYLRPKMIHIIKFITVLDSIYNNRFSGKLTVQNTHYKYIEKLGLRLLNDFMGIIYYGRDYKTVVPTFEVDKQDKDYFAFFEGYGGEKSGTKISKMGKSKDEEDKHYNW